MRIAKEADKRRKEKRKSWIVVAGIALISIGLMVADFLWLQHKARKRHERHHQHIEQTNFPATNVPAAESIQITTDE